MGSSRMHPYPPERQLCGFMAEFLDDSSRKGSGWSQHVKQNPKIVIVCHFKSTLRFAPFCEPALNKVTRMLNLSSSLFSKFLFSSHWYLSLSSSFFVSFLANRGLGLTLHSILFVWCSLPGLVLSVLSCLVLSCLVLVSSDCCTCACAWIFRHLSYSRCSLRAILSS